MASLFLKKGDDANAKNREKSTPRAYYLNMRMESISKEEKYPAQLSRLQNHRPAQTMRAQEMMKTYPPGQRG